MGRGGGPRLEGACLLAFGAPRHATPFNDRAGGRAGFCKRELHHMRGVACLERAVGLARGSPSAQAPVRQVSSVGGYNTSTLRPGRAAPLVPSPRTQQGRVNGHTATWWQVIGLSHCTAPSRTLEPLLERSQPACCCCPAHARSMSRHLPITRPSQPAARAARLQPAAGLRRPPACLLASCLPCSRYAGTTGPRLSPTLVVVRLGFRKHAQTVS